MSTPIRAKIASLPGIHQLVDSLLDTYKAWSLATILREINQTLNENRPAYYAVADNRDLIAQEFLLFENSGADDLEDSVDSQFAIGLSVDDSIHFMHNFRPYYEQGGNPQQAVFKTLHTTGRAMGIGDNNRVYLDIQHNFKTIVNSLNSR